MCRIRVTNTLKFDVFIYLCIGLSLSDGRPITHDPAVMYLAQFGYLNQNFLNPTKGYAISEELFTEAIREFQAFAGLKPSGELDNETVHTMSLPRCGVKDIVTRSDSRSKRYAIGDTRWKEKKLSYRIAKYPSGLDRRKVDKEIAKAFALWSQHADLEFTPKKSEGVQIEIQFVKGDHCFADPFDGPDGVLAHTFSPLFGGDIHFDDAETWIIDYHRGEGTNLFQVAAHEIGHSLGLSHSDVKSSLMAPFYRDYDPKFKLHDDDIKGIQVLYGRKSGESSSPTEGSVQHEDDAELCNDARIDTVFSSSDGSTYAFKGNHYWKLTEDGIATGYPRIISSKWPGLPGNINAAFVYKNTIFYQNMKTYFFKGSLFWRYTGYIPDEGFPRNISKGFPGIPDNVDAALVWSGNGKIYFFKGSEFWRFDHTLYRPVTYDYPKPISNWEGIPDSLDAALHYTNGFSYFFKDGKYYRFNDKNFAVEEGDPPFPRAAGEWWFGCAKGTTGSAGSGFSPPTRENPKLDQSSSSVVEINLGLLTSVMVSRIFFLALAYI